MARLDHVNISVAHLDQSIAWYGSVFGFEKVEGGVTARGTRWAILAHEDSMIAMTEYAERAPAGEGSAESEGSGTHRIAHFGLRVENADDWRRTVERHGLKLGYGGEIRYPRSRSWYVRDPSGHEIEVSCANGKPLRFG